MVLVGICWRVFVGMSIKELVQMVGEVESRLRPAVQQPSWVPQRHQQGCTPYYNRPALENHSPQREGVAASCLALVCACQKNEADAEKRTDGNLRLQCTTPGGRAGARPRIHQGHARARLRKCSYHRRPRGVCMPAGDTEGGGLDMEMPVAGLMMGMALRPRVAEGWWSLMLDCW